MTTSADDRTSSAALADVVQSRDRQIADLLAALDRKDAQVERLCVTIDRLTRLVEALQSAPPPGTPGPVPPAPVPAASSAPAIGPTFGEVWNEYYEALGAATWKKNAASMMRWPLAWFSPSVCARSEPGRRTKVPVQGPDMLLSDLRTHHWTTFVAELLPRGPTHPRGAFRGLGVTTRNLIVSRTLAMLNWAVEQERLPSSPLERVKQEPKKKKRQTRFTDEDLVRFRPHATALAWARQVTICDAGTRPDEARLLLWSQVDGARESGETELQPWQCKGKKEGGTIFFTPRCFEAYAALPRDPANPYVFGAPGTTEPYSKVHLWRMFRQAADAAGLKAAPGDGTVHQHDGRRDFGTKLIHADASLPKVQKLLRHKHVQTTMLYIDVPNEDLREAHGRLATATRQAPQRANANDAPATTIEALRPHVGEK